ncbi:MAG: hypothetical protein GWP56_10650 [Gammaproteobacteria bacterium]|jgi:hypothetical protein|nr:hypothetical protein [Gammaproteobacteria bacterium]
MSDQASTVAINQRQAGYRPPMRTGRRLRDKVSRACARKFSLIFLALAIGHPSLLYAGEFTCGKGKRVSADLGDGVVMHTCIWEKAPDVLLRTGPLELIKNGVLILKMQTNSDGKLHGEYTSWNDAGEIVENGNYRNGEKHGTWLITSENGLRETLHYNNGILQEP